jgi:putative holliday junction resolvase
MTSERKPVALGLDVGTKTIGVAVSDALGLLAHPVATIRRKGVKADVTAILALATPRAVAIFVVGLPYELDGNERRSARLARQIGEELTARGAKVEYVDERFSTVDAETALREGGSSFERRADVIDQAAAAVILGRWLARTA